MQTFKPKFLNPVIQLSNFSTYGQRAHVFLLGGASALVDALAGSLLQGSKHKDPGAFIFYHLLEFSRFVDGYARMIEELDDPHFELRLDDFQGEF